MLLLCLGGGGETPPDAVASEDGSLDAAARHAAELEPLHALLVARCGEIALERRFRGPTLDTPVNIKSVSKSVLSALVGIAIHEGRLEGPDQRIQPFFDHYLPDNADPRKARITIGHLLSMRSGLERTSGRSYGRWVASDNWVRHVIRRPMTGEPGGFMMYSTGNSHLLSAILTRATGRSTHDYARAKLARPLGIRLPRWRRDPQGIYFGGNQMRMSPRAMVRFGELYRNDGEHDGRQVIPASWVRASLTPRGRSPFSGELYGYGWFISEVRGYRTVFAWGYGGQFIFVVPELALTVVTTSDHAGPRDIPHLQNIHRLLRDHIVPAVSSAPSCP